MEVDPQSATLAFLAGIENGAEIVETHISRVVLGRTRAFKLKRAVRFPYLDFSTPQKRFAMCERETRLNRRTAPKLYLGARRVTKEKDGALTLDGAGELIDGVVEMRRFDAGVLFQDLAASKRLTTRMIEDLARVVAKLHDEAEIIGAHGGAAAMRHALVIAEASARQTPPASMAEVTAHIAKLRELIDRHAALLDARHAYGKTRHCHGDLILRNICLFEGRPTPFDCVEFSDELAQIDVLYDLAFLLMDLCRNDQLALANVALNRYLDWRDETDGLPLLPLFMSMRATIRAYVAAAQKNAAEARLYFDLAVQLARDNTPCLVAIGGFSGSGKSSVAACVAPLIGAAAPGARSLNSDRLRKKLFGVDPTHRLPQEAYRSSASERVYAEMILQTRRVLKAGWPVVVDAVFDRPESRADIEAVARELSIPFHGFWLEADLATRLNRVDARRNDPSDATREVVLMQAERDAGEIGWRHIDATRDIATIAADIATAS